MNDRQLSSVDKEKDFGILITSDLKSSQNCSEVVETANKLVGFMGHYLENRSEKVIIKPDSSLV